MTGGRLAMTGGPTLTQTLTHPATRPSHPPHQSRQRAANARRHHVHACNQDHPIHRAGRRLGHLIGEVRNELDEHRAEQRAGDRGNAAHHQAYEQRDRNQHGEAVGCDEGIAIAPSEPATPVHIALAAKVRSSAARC